MLIRSIAATAAGEPPSVRRTEVHVIDAGYFARRVAPKPDWLNASAVREICSASGCISVAPDGWVGHWLHNEFGWFNRVADALAVIPPDQWAAFRAIGKTLDGSEPWPSLERLWREAILEWRYEPSVIDGQPVAVCLTATVTIDVM